MKRLAIGAITAAGVFSAATFADAQTAEAPPAPAATPAAACTPASQVYALSHWKHPKRGVAVCPTDPDSLAKLRRKFRDYRTYRLAAPFPGPGHGPKSPSDGRWWAIPWCAVSGESGGNFYVNGDGGYQIIPGTWIAHGGGKFSQTAGGATPLEQHIIAHRAALAGEPWYGGCGYN